jgi:hypothetical protein
MYNSWQFLSVAHLYNHNNVRTWTAIFLEHLANTSFMASIQVWTETLAALLQEYSSCLFLAHPVSCCLLQRPMFHTHPSLPAGELSTNVQVNNMAALHRIYTDTHAYLHHIYITIHALLHTSSTLLGRPVGSDPSRLSQCWRHWIDQVRCGLQHS